MEQYTIDYFIKKFEAIPEEFWCTDRFVDFFNLKLCCALGHCGERITRDTKEAADLSNIFKKTNVL